MEIQAYGSSDDEQRIDLNLPGRMGEHLVKRSDEKIIFLLAKGSLAQNWGEAKNAIKPMGVSGEVKIRVDWGDPEGPTVSGSASVKASDDNGNTATVTATQDSDGGSVEIAIEHEEKDNGSNNQ